MKKIIAIMLTLLMLFSLVACAGAPEDSNQNEAGAATNQTEEKEVENATETEEVVAEEETTQETEETEETEEAEEAEEAENDKVATGIRPEFKKAMDDYEAFYDEYCDFMVKYKENPSDLSLLTKYADMAAKLIDMDEAFEAWDEDELSKEELKYYLEVSARITEKLVDVAV